MNIKTLTSYLTRTEHIYGHLGNSFFHRKRFNIKDSSDYFIVEQQTLFNFKVELFILNVKYVAYIVASDPVTFHNKFNNILLYFMNFPNENFIAL